MENNFQNYSKLYNEYEKTLKKDFSSRFEEYEFQRKKANFLYKVKSFIYFALIPFITLCVIAHFNITLIVTIVLLLSVTIFSIFIKNIMFQIIPLISIFIVAFLVHYKLDFLVAVLYIGLFITVDIFYFMQYKEKCNRDFMKTIKKQNMSDIIENIGNLKWYGSDFDKVRTSQVIPDFTIRNSGLFMSYNTRYIDDEFHGVYKDVPFAISETKLYNISENRKTRSKIKIFQGIIIKFKANKNVKNRTIVSTKRNFTQQNRFWLGLLGAIALEIFSIFSTIIGWKDPSYPFLCRIIIPILIVIIPILLHKGYQKQKKMFKKINLEDSDFEKFFNVYSSDQIESRYLITPAFMDRFKNLQTSFGAKIIKCSFYEDSLMIAITTNKNLFEIGSLFKPFNDTDSMKQFFSELESIYNMVEILKLDEKTGL